MNEIARESAKCLDCPSYFVSTYCHIQDASEGPWIRFSLWAEQRQVLDAFHEHKYVVVLKARQLGLTWLALCYALWMALFKPGVTILLFSLRDDEAMAMLTRLKGVYKKLPDWMKCGAEGETKPEDSKHLWRLSNGSTVQAFPTGTGDSYTAALAIIDEADMLGNDLTGTLNSVQPTIDAGGKMFLISKSNKKLPQSPFKRIYTAAREGNSHYFPVFLPWHVRPGRTQEWYQEMRRTTFAEQGSYDFVSENYPNTDAEALASSTVDKRIPGEWLVACYRDEVPIRTPVNVQHMVGIRVYREPSHGRRYVVSGDPAKGNPNSDDSAIVVMDQTTLEEVAFLASKISPKRLAEFCDCLARFYNRAAVLIENNNHGQAVLQWWSDHSNLPMLKGHDGSEGWSTSSRKAKNLLYDHAADLFRDRQTTVHSFKVFHQLCLIDADKLEAPPPDMDDAAMAYVLALMGCKISRYGALPSDREMPPLTPKAYGSAFGMPPDSGAGGFKPFGVERR